MGRRKTKETAKAVISIEEITAFVFVRAESPIKPWESPIAWHKSPIEPSESPITRHKSPIEPGESPITWQEPRSPPSKPTSNELFGH